MADKFLNTGGSGGSGATGPAGPAGPAGATGAGSSVKVYSKANLPLNTVDGTSSLITDGTLGDTPCIGYYYNGIWYRIFDNSPIVDNFNSVVLTFDTGQKNNEDLASNYGSAISIASDAYIVNGTGCPSIDLEWTTATGPVANLWEVHSSVKFVSAFGSRPHVLQLDVDVDNGVLPPNPVIKFMTTAEVQVRIVGFRIGNLISQLAEPAKAWVINIYEDNTSGNKVYTQTTNSLGRGAFQDIVINYIGETGKNYALEFDDQEQGRYTTAINNLTFEQHINQVPTGDQ
tara:strand:+ start:995 stop:1855 length:861 start_codon:yes stop_codon:yes gene_type:complete